MNMRKEESIKFIYIAKGCLGAFFFLGRVRAKKEE